MIVSDNGAELTSNAFLAWWREIGVEWHYIVFAGRKTRRGIELQRRQFHRATAIR
jgi:putative transposase